MQYSRNIIVAGYPKSGNTWLCRLIAQSLDCEFLGPFKPKEDRLDSVDREGPNAYRVFKSHYFSPMKSDPDRPDRIIYIVRDVRDVVCSGLTYFGENPKYDEFYRKDRDHKGKSYGDLTNRMMECVLHGGKYYPGCSWPWGQHVSGYLNFGLPVVRYEDLIDDTATALKTILMDAGLPADEEKIREAADFQSFDTAKKRFEEQGSAADLRLMRKGRKGSYREELAKPHQKVLRETYAPLLKRLGYLEDDD